MNFQCRTCGYSWNLDVPFSAAQSVRCPLCNPRAMPPPPQPKAQSKTNLGRAILIGGGIAAAALILYKIVQANTDKEYCGRTLPQSVLDDLKEKHVAEHGCRCLRCGSRVRYDDLRGDHIVAYAKGGRTSIQNTQIICDECNQEKSDDVSWTDRIRGRGGRES